jgi:threonine aldolase
MNFASDNTAGCAPDIMAALARANAGPAGAYGNDAATKRLTGHFSELFETEVQVFPVATGTAANSLSLSTLVPPYGGVICLDQAHIHEDECGAPEFFSGGARIFNVPGKRGKLDAADVERVVKLNSAANFHRMQPAAVSVTQLGEGGELYSPDEIGAIGEAAKRHGLGLHMDGARFANAVAGINCRPADVTWRAGVDILSFGATKNGAWAAEAIVVFKPELARSLLYRRQRAGHTFSKMRFLSVQLEAYLAQDLWLRNARHANGMMSRIAEALVELPDVRLLDRPRGNLTFVNLPVYLVEPLAKAGFVFYHWGNANYHTARLVTAFNTELGQVKKFVSILRKHSRGRKPPFAMDFLPRP